MTVKENIINYKMTAENPTFEDWFKSKMPNLYNTAQLMKSKGNNIGAERLTADFRKSYNNN